MSDLFGWCLLALRFSATNSAIKITQMMSTGTCGLKLYARKNIFKKRPRNMRFWIIFILVKVSVFGGITLGRFSLCFFFFFLIFCPWSTMVADIFTHCFLITPVLRNICDRLLLKIKTSVTNFPKGGHSWILLFF